MHLNVKVIPRSSKNEVVGELADGSLKVKLAPIPEKGKANDELRDVLARHFNVPLNDIEIISGLTSTRKKVRVLGR